MRMRLYWRGCYQHRLRCPRGAHGVAIASPRASNRERRAAMYFPSRARTPGHMHTPRLAPHMQPPEDPSATAQPHTTTTRGRGATSRHGAVGAALAWLVMANAGLPDDQGRCDMARNTRRRYYSPATTNRRGWPAQQRGRGVGQQCSNEMGGIEKCQWFVDSIQCTMLVCGV